MKEIEQLLARSRDDLAATRLLEERHPALAVSRAYYAVLYAAEAALLVLGEARSKHAGVIAAFGKLVVKEGGVPAEMERIFRSLFDRRNLADYKELSASPELARGAIGDAERFVDAVEAWIHQRQRG